MTNWTSFRTKITNFITNNGNAVTIIPRTPASGTYGGYNPGSDNDGTSVSTVGVTGNYLITKTGQDFGKLKTGEIAIVLKYSETVNKDSEITWQSEPYDVVDIKEIRADDVIIAKRITLSRQLD